MLKFGHCLGYDAYATLKPTVHPCIPEKTDNQTQTKEEKQLC